MTVFRDVVSENRFEQGFVSPDGQLACVWADYAVRGATRVILHVEADDVLRGTGAAGRFMESLTDYARSHTMEIEPRCGYAVAWYRRHPKAGDVLAA